jgi:hypothetical protein
MAISLWLPDFQISMIWKYGEIARRIWLTRINQAGVREGRLLICRARASSHAITLTIGASKNTFAKWLRDLAGLL